MSLKSVNICLDGYNLELLQGTGIKSYGMTLMKALVELEACVDLLCSRPISGKNPLLNEVLFFNQNSEAIRAIRSLSILDLFKSLSLGLSGFGLNTNRIYMSDFVVKPDYDYVFDELNNLGGSIFCRNNLFAIANKLKTIVGVNSQVYIDKKIDVWHSTCPLPIKVNRAKFITTIHDLIPLRLPYSTLDDKRFYFNLIKYVIKKSDLIISVSENTKLDLISQFDVNPDKVFVTYQPIPNADLTLNDDFFSSVMHRYKLEKGKYFLFVGAIEPKKNLGRLLQAYSKTDLNYPLVIVGKKGWLWKREIGNLKDLFGQDYENHIKFLNYVSRLDLIHLYYGATALVFPSLYEGFGLPPLEAMYRGCPVITSNISSLPEICGDAAIYVDPYSVVEIQGAISKVASDASLRNQMSKQGLLKAKDFGMTNYLSNLESAYKLVL